MRIAFLSPIVLLLGFGGLPPVARADIYTLTSGNSQLKIDPDSSNGIFSWKVDGYDILHQEWFWLRTAEDTQEYALASPTYHFDSAQVAGNTGVLRYSGNGLAINVLLSLTGGGTGSLASDLMQTVTIRNTTKSALKLDFFQFVDMDLSSYDTAQFVDPDLVVQTGSEKVGAGVFLNQTIVSDKGLVHGQAGSADAILNSLNDGQRSTLTDTDAAQGDVAWALQWKKTLPPRGSLLITEELNVTDPVLVPEPAAVIGLLTVICGCALLRRRERRASGRLF